MEPAPGKNVILQQPGVYNSWSYYTLPKMYKGDKQLPNHTFQTGYQTLMPFENIDKNHCKYLEEGGQSCNREDRRSVNTETQKKSRLGEIIYSKLRYRDYSFSSRLFYRFLKVEVRVCVIRSSWIQCIAFESSF